ncbi:MAG: TetR/AcrR family transcriptional regulator [Solirubrobacteraceae bacterium]
MSRFEHDPELWAHIQPESSRRLLLSALEAFAARGFHSATTREIGEGAGLSAAGVYVHYKSKTDLLYEISRIGHDASLAAVESALEGASEDPVARVCAYVFAFAKWHADNHVLARVIQYEFKNLPTRQFRRIVVIRDRFEELMRDELRNGVAAGGFEISDLEGTTLAILSLCIDLVRWYEPAPEHTSEHVATLYVELVMGMLRARLPAPVG